jgi:gamma-glutamyl:cysteine ligase YbdK (ATP-grasp superfamily)
VENRVLPAGPTVIDVIANAAFFYGVVRALAEESRPVWTRLPFEAAAANFDAACKDGIDARFTWPGRGRYSGTTEVDAVSLIRDELLPLAEAGLDAWGVEPADRDLYLGVIEERCRRRVNGASWQAATFHKALDAGLSRDDALAATTRRYRELMHQGAPVHSWPVGLPEPVSLG